MTRLATAVRQGARRILARTGLYRLQPREPSYLGTGLMFHRVIPDDCRGFVRHSRQFMVTASGLERCVRHFQERGYRFVTPDQIAGELSNPEPNRTPFVLLTFDDGFRDNLELALPLLRKLGVPFTVYVCTGVPDGLWIVWPYVLDQLLTIPGRKSLNFEWNGERISLPTRTPADQDHAYEILRARIINLPEAERRDFLGRAAQGTDLDPAAACRALSMSWDELRQLAADPLVTIGAHTVHHVELASLAPDQARAEIENGRHRLSEQLGIPIRHFAYPFGSKPTPEAGGADLVAGLGFATAVTTRPGPLVAGHRHHLFQLPRSNVEDREHPALYDLQLKSAFDRLQGRPPEFAIG